MNLHIGLWIAADLDHIWIESSWIWIMILDYEFGYHELYHCDCEFGYREDLDHIWIIYEFGYWIMDCSRFGSYRL